MIQVLSLVCLSFLAGFATPYVAHWIDWKWTAAQKRARPKP